jgi:hypothetical protein
MRTSKIALGLLCAALTMSACKKPKSPDEAVDALEQWETQARAHTDFTTLSSSDRSLGADPFALAQLPTGGFVGVLRGRDAVVLLDDTLSEIDRKPAPRSTRGIAVDKVGGVFVVGEDAPEIERFHVVDRALVVDAPLHVSGVVGLKDIAVGDEGALDVVDELGGRVLAVSATGDVLSQLQVGHGAVRVLRAGHFVVAQAVLEHRITIATVDDTGAFLAQNAIHLDNDGPFWGIAARVVDGALLVAAGHVENHPLDRTEGSFGFIDSFVSVWRVQDASGMLTSSLLLSRNVGELHVVTPKALAFSTNEALEVVGAATDQRLTIALPTKTTTSRPSVPGVSRVIVDGGGTLRAADPLLDAWVTLAPDRVAVLKVPDTLDTRSVDEKVGEALFFTSLMAPAQKTDAQLSRFTCETCHFEGVVDGRTHHTGRDDVHATTKPLLGLFNNKPHFSRALDKTMARMVHAEFRVAGSNSPLDPWFATRVVDVPWLLHLGASGTLAPEDLRRSFMSFLMRFTPRTNGRVAARSDDAHFTDVEREGARVFEQRCVRCHAARLIADDPSTAQPSSTWEHFIFSDNGPLVWGSDGYWKTGVEPYVYDDGARTPSLRRLERKWPYFTNGHAKTLQDVLTRVRFDDATLVHEGAAAPGLRALSDDEQRALSAFLVLL